MMVARANILGWDVEFNPSTGWVYTDTGVPITDELRTCAECGERPTEKGYDACIGHIDNVKSACCGHGNRKRAYKITATNRGYVGG